MFKPKAFLYSIFFSMTLVVGAQADTLMGFVKAYHEKGIESIERLLQSYLSQRAFWEDLLETKDTAYGYYENLDYLFLINKADPKLALYQMGGEKITKIDATKALVGSKIGVKLTEGDKATPIGVYQIIKKIAHPSAFYGPLALVTNYPNPLDVVLKRTGHGIWIHGMPLDGKRDTNTKGCIAIDNNALQNYDKIVKGKKSLLIVYEGNLPQASKEELATLLSNLYAWRAAWAKNNLVSYLDFYAPDFKHANGMGIKNYEKFKTKIFAKNEDKIIRISSVNVTPYPTSDGTKLFRIAFDQDYEAYKHKKLTYSSHGPKELYVRLKDQKMQIVVEK
ncbi:L,D-transpeptidase family protein [Helicobacter ailurogastricus]|uniref:L,D-transpeptidase family protein n=1 Tax=Helicobacter ailurogastricus TaxID=1578720 RepID=UPI0022C53D77|nr:L,D-transpeptidase family protein [Helicobacter ailurogastricus]GLH58029.1 Putative periplasmic protein involved in flagellin deglycosylation [Helicobacter ailurogastricus]GLH59066.1 Putative periplasmic protein involved in flagellin deglycosylation [Helicobacter ailurogastricus]GMB91386.1 Putative periplasmic protein involved in flagellin deglycosylation [Helicobacter ailurogastricus]